MKDFKCRDAGMDCDWKTEGENENDIMTGVEEHARTQHSDIQFTDEMSEKVRGLIKNRDQKAA